MVINERQDLQNVRVVGARIANRLDCRLPYQNQRVQIHACPNPEKRERLLRTVEGEGMSGMDANQISFVAGTIFGVALSTALYAYHASRINK